MRQKLTTLTLSALYLSLLPLGFSSFSVLAHDTNVTHPVLTLQAIRLIEAKDKVDGAFAELYREVITTDYINNKPYPLHWGVWNSKEWDTETNSRIFDNMKEAEEDDKNTYPQIYKFNDVNVISGVVREDHPATKVINHFYHAYSTEKLLPVGLNSKERALPFFVRSINQFGYEVNHDFNQDDWYDVDDTLKNEIQPLTPNGNKVYFAKQLAFQSFGEALHHVEDMSSIAHVQGDGHLLIRGISIFGWRPFEDVDWLDEEKEDYEGNYVPNKIFQFHGNNPGVIEPKNWFLDDTDYAEVNSVDNIWPKSATNARDLYWDANSLVRKVYNASVFQGSLDANIFTDDVASGEIEDMFGYEITDSEGNTEKRGLFHDSRTIFKFPVWHIEGVGNYHYLPADPESYYFTNDWWETSDNGGPEGYFYIEQKLGDLFAPEESDFAIAKNGIRRKLLTQYFDKNDLDPNKKKLVTAFAEELIPLAVQYSAGFSAFWYSIVNSPPYLKAVKVKQQVIAIKQADNSIADYEFTAYDAKWKNGHGHLQNLDEGKDFDKALFTAKRKLERVSETAPLYHNQDIDVYLSFSEPIKSPLEANSGFELGFKLESAITNKEVSESDALVKLNLTSDDVVMLDLDDPKNSSNSKVKAFIKDFPIYGNESKHMLGSRWLVIIKGQGAGEKETQLSKIKALYGAVRLVVKANDKNIHHPDLKRGSALDDKPRTPARVRAVLEGIGGHSDNLKPKFQWYDGVVALTEEFANSKDSDGKPITKKNFKYDTGDGDQNHILWFSPKVSKEDLIKQINKNARQGYHKVSITGLPKKDEKE